MGRLATQIMIPAGINEEKSFSSESQFNYGLSQNYARYILSANHIKFAMLQ